MDASSTRRPTIPPLWREEIFIGRTTERYRMLIGVFVTLVLCPFCNNVFAEPYLQLDAYLAVYDGGCEESIVSTQLNFTLSTPINSNSDEVKGKNKGGGGIDDPFEISGVFSPKVPLTDSPPGLGLIYLDSVPILAVSDMLRGALPVLNHGVFDTYYYDHAFTLDPAIRAALYDSLDELSEPGPVVAVGSLCFEDFQVDMSGLVSGLVAHLDLYTKKSDDTFMYFALLP